MFSRKSAWPGMLSPAFVRRFSSITFRNSLSVILPRPTSNNVPTTALTIFLRKRFAVISKYQLASEV